MMSKADFLGVSLALLMYTATWVLCLHALLVRVEKLEDKVRKLEADDE